MKTSRIDLPRGPVPAPGDPRRRQWLKLVAATGILGPAGWSGWMSEALAAGTLSGVQGVNRLEGSATVNGQAAKVGTPVKLGDKVVTARGSQAVILINDDAFLMRGDSAIEFNGKAGVLSDMLVASGKVLSVFSRKPVAIKAATATVGIRGTGCYLEVEPTRAYLCLCYGEAAIDGPGMSGPKIVKTTYHEQPLYLSDVGGVMRAEPGPFLNHTDDELILLESLVGREPPFLKTMSPNLRRY